MQPSDPTRFPPTSRTRTHRRGRTRSRRPASFGMTPVPFTIGDVLARSWQIYRGSDGALHRSGRCLGSCYVGTYVGPDRHRQGDAERSNLAATSSGSLRCSLCLFMIWMSLGLCVVMLDVARGREATVGGLFSGGRFLWRRCSRASCSYWRSYGTLGGCSSAGAVIWAGHDGGPGPEPAGSGLRLGVLSPVSSSAYIVMVAVLAVLLPDRRSRRGVIDSLRISYRITRGHAGPLFVLALLFGLINLGGILACGVGSSSRLPYILLLCAVAYLALTGQATADPYAKGEPLAELEPL